MAKSRKRKATRGGGAAKGGGPRGGGTTGGGRILLIAALVLVVAGGGYWWLTRPTGGSGAPDAFAALVAAGQPALARVRSPGSQGNAHLDAGQTKNYLEPFPTSGDHSGQAARAGFYEGEVPKVNLVHALEHGNVVIYYDTPGEDAIGYLKEWTGRFKGPWDGVLATRSPGLGEAVVMTAWTRSLRMNSFDAAEAAAFMDAFRGRGPENKVR